MNTYLKMKIKSLDGEAKAIRQSEQRIARRLRKSYLKNNAAPGDMKTWRADKYSNGGDPLHEDYHKNRDEQISLAGSLRHHRVFPLRSEARSALLAYGFLRGRRYREMEATTGGWMITDEKGFQVKAENKPDWKRVEEIIKKFSSEDQRVWEQKLEQWMQEKAAS